MGALYRGAVERVAGAVEVMGGAVKVDFDWGGAR
jgi:hypothetical protein